ncbi:MAG: hypothetical protein WCF57_04975 [Pyrinomonadaceae bacterium]
MIESKRLRLKTLKLVALLMFLATTAAAQRGPAPRILPPPGDVRAGQSRSSTMQVELPSPVAEMPVPFGVPSADGTVALQPLGSVSPDLNFESKVVTGVPFSAETVTEHVQTLADGNRFVRRSSATVYRDHLGRTRRDHTDARRGGGVVDAEQSSPVVSIINDPVALTNIVLDHRTKSARRMELPRTLYNVAQTAGGDNTGEPRFGILVPRSARPRNGTPNTEPAANKPERRTEKLESRTIEGVLAEGTRTTVVIPAGAFDNERPLEITQERWYSPELQTVVLMRHNDPRFGETSFSLTNINRSEPDAAIFRIPADYKIKERGRGINHPGMMRRPPPN